MPLNFKEMMRVEILARGFPPAHQKQMIGHEASGIRGDEQSINEHSKRYTPCVYGLAKGNVFGRLVT